MQKIVLQSLMKHLLYTIALLFVPFCYSQDTGMIVGKIMDAELRDSPLVMANVLLKGTAKKQSTDINGMFVFENLKAGNYTLVCSFVGYESEEIKVSVDALEPVELQLSLGASKISADDIAMAMAHQDQTPQKHVEQ